MLQAISLVLLSACGAASPASSSTPSATAPAAHPASEPAAGNGLELVCEGEGIHFRITDATLALSDVEQQRADRRWNQVRATYTLDANGEPHAGSMAGARDQDYAFLVLDEMGTAGDRKVQLIVSSPDGKSASIKWPSNAMDQAPSSRKVTCSGSLMTASPN